MRKRSVLISVLGAAVLAAGIAYAGKAGRDISSKRHPNLAAAQKLCLNAYQRITDAQKANEWDLDGHAKTAKELLEKVNAELKLAAEKSNENKGN
jgi:hypothetical protein